MESILKIGNNGTRYYYDSTNRKLHRDDGPAVETVGVVKYWYQNGELSRIGGAAIIWEDGVMEWYLNGNRHRDDGPAVVYLDNGFEWYLFNNELIQPDEFEHMDEWLLRLNTDEKYSYDFIHNIQGLISFIINPSDKQRRVHQMKWVI